MKTHRCLPAHLHALWHAQLTIPRIINKVIYLHKMQFHFFREGNWNCQTQHFMLPFSIKLHYHFYCSLKFYTKSKMKLTFPHADKISICIHLPTAFILVTKCTLLWKNIMHHMMYLSYLKHVPRVAGTNSSGPFSGSRHSKLTVKNSELET